MARPIVALERSGIVESEHLGQITIVVNGELTLEVGGRDRFMPRSTLKPLQLVAMLRAGLPLSGPQLALATSSHSGETWQQRAIVEMLTAYGLDPTSLELPPDQPLGAILGTSPGGPGLERQKSSKVANNCSGQHAAFLITCKVNNWPMSGYSKSGHPLQQIIAQTIQELTNEPLGRQTVDGCGLHIPIVSPLGLATAFDRIARADEQTPEGRTAKAMRTWPDWVAGPQRNSTRWMAAHPGVIVKDGAEGVLAAALPKGIAMAAKIQDGAQRAARVVLAAFFEKFGLRTPTECLSEFEVYGGDAVIGRLHCLLELENAL